MGQDVMDILIAGPMDYTCFTLDPHLSIYPARNGTYPQATSFLGGRQSVQ